MHINKVLSQRSQIQIPMGTAREHKQVKYREFRPWELWEKCSGLRQSQDTKRSSINYYLSWTHRHLHSELYPITRSGWVIINCWFARFVQIGQLLLFLKTKFYDKNFFKKKKQYAMYLSVYTKFILLWESTMSKKLRIVLGKILNKERKETDKYLFVIFEFYYSEEIQLLYLYQMHYQVKSFNGKDLPLF